MRMIHLAILHVSWVHPSPVRVYIVFCLLCTDEHSISEFLLGWAPYFCRSENTSFQESELWASSAFLGHLVRVRKDHISFILDSKKVVSRRYVHL